MNMNRFLSCCLLIIGSLVIVSCASRADSKLIDKESGTYEVSVQSYQDCGGIWHGKNMCIENLRPQIYSLGSDICGKKPYAIGDCAEREGPDGREVYCVVQCNQPTKVNKSVLQKARLCQEKGGIWIDNRCELDLS